MAEFIYQMYQARKAHGDKVILDDVTLSFYPGAKIGVVGPNGMGKSTLLKIMAGLEEVCKLLLEAPDLLLLDEPTNHLDAESVLWLEQFLRTYPGAVLAVTHDRYFLDNVAEWICEVDRGSLFPYKGNYSTYLETKAARLEGQGQREEKLAKRLRSELEWVRSSPKARQAKSKARIERYEQMAAEARSFEKASVSDITIPVPPRLGAKVIEAKHIKKAFGDRVLIDDLSFTLPQGGIVGVIGPNGVGKSTLFKAIVGLEPLSGGELEIGESVSISYVDQNREGIDPNKKLWEVVSDGLDYMKVGDTEIPSRAYAEAGRRAVGRRAQPPEPGADAQAGRQPAASRRAYERPRRRDAGKPGGGAAGISRLRRGDQP